MTLPAKFPESGGPPLSRAEEAINAIITHLEEREGEKCVRDCYPKGCFSLTPAPSCDCPCHQPKEEKSPQKEHLDHGMNAIADNLTLSSKLLYQPKEATDSWERQIDTAAQPSLITNSGLEVVYDPNALKAFIKKLITREKAAQLQEVREVTERAITEYFHGLVAITMPEATEKSLKAYIDARLAALEGVETAL